MTDVMAVSMLTEQCVGHSHADDTLEALLRNMSSSGKVCIANCVMQGHKVEDIVLTEPMKAGDILKLCVTCKSQRGFRRRNTQVLRP